LREYELTLIVQPEITDEGITAICERLDGILEKNGAHRLFYDDMGKRRLSYSIRKFQKGHYLTLFFLDEGRVVDELERTLKLDDSILRFLTVLANPEVKDVEARRTEAAELERIRAEKAAERAAREAEEAAREAEEARARAAEEEASGEAGRAEGGDAAGAPDASSEAEAPAAEPEGKEA
jgi:small subunit ribosomal protein S6